MITSKHYKCKIWLKLIQQLSSYEITQHKNKSLSFNYIEDICHFQTQPYTEKLQKIRYFISVKEYTDRFSDVSGDEVK